MSNDWVATHSSEWSIFFSNGEYAHTNKKWVQRLQFRFNWFVVCLFLYLCAGDSDQIHAIQQFFGSKLFLKKRVLNIWINIHVWNVTHYDSKPAHTTPCIRTMQTQLIRLIPIFCLAYILFLFIYLFLCTKIEAHTLTESLPFVTYGRNYFTYDFFIEIGRFFDAAVYMLNALCTVCTSKGTLFSIKVDFSMNQNSIEFTLFTVFHQLCARWITFFSWICMTIGCHDKITADKLSRFKTKHTHTRERKKKHWMDENTNLLMTRTN